MSASDEPSGAGEIPTFDLGAARLRPFVEGDAPAWLAIVTDEAITSCTSWGIRSLEEMSALVRKLIAGYADSSSRRWALEVPGQGLVGSCGFKWWDRPNAAAEIAYELSPRHWRRGITGSAVRTAIHHGFTAMALDRVEATVMIDNQPSTRLLEGAGFVRQGLLGEGRLVAGVRRDFLAYALPRSAWPVSAPR
jgi:ribosomal-protein-alanine N-acetyltransferase